MFDAFSHGLRHLRFRVFRVQCLGNVTFLLSNDRAANEGMGSERRHFLHLGLLPAKDPLSPDIQRLMDGPWMPILISV